MNLVNKDTFFLWGKNLLRVVGLLVRSGDSKKAVMKGMVRNINTIMLIDILADSGNIWLLHEPEKLNCLLETFCNLSVIGCNNSLGHTMSAQTLACAVVDQQNALSDLNENASCFRRSLEYIDCDSPNCHIFQSFISRTLKNCLPEAEILHEAPLMCKKCS